MKPIHHRRSIRIKGYDYGQAGLYFITLCCHDRICRFGHVENGIKNAVKMATWALNAPENFLLLDFIFSIVKLLFVQLNRLSSL